MEYKTEGCSLTVKDTITVRDQLRYSSEVAFTLDIADRIVAWWEGAKLVIEKWECEQIEDYKTFDMDKSTNPEHARLIAWAATTVWSHMAQLKEVPKK